MASVAGSKGGVIEEKEDCSEKKDEESD